MVKYYSSGEIAKICNISVRTVQYYDKQNILKPSKLSEGGRRQYSENDYIKLKSICLYRLLGLSLDKIKIILKEDNTESIENIITHQSAKIDQEITRLKGKKEKLSIVLENIKLEGKLSINSIDELDNIIIKKKEHKKSNVIILIMMACYFLFMIIGYSLVKPIGGIAPIIFTVVSFMFLFILVFYHKKTNAYICGKCSNKFTISFLHDLISPNWFNGKYILCPSCRKLSWCKEVYKS